MPGKEPGEKQRLFELLIHDLTGPLSVISASTTRLLQPPKGNRSPKGLEQSTLHRILRNARRCQIILQEMVEMLHSEAGLFRRESFSVERILIQSILEVLEVDAPESVDELARQERTNEFFAMLEPYGIFVRISGKYGRAYFHHDQRKVQQIIRNLLSNALKHKRQRVEVKISGETDLLVSIEDDGPGIAETDQDSIFQRFVRLKTEEDRSVPGLGLGLAGVRALLEAMGGKISLVSQEGFGTAFSVSIPPLE